jgi:hypothetical protein
MKAIFCFWSGSKIPGTYVFTFFYMKVLESSDYWGIYKIGPLNISIILKDKE